VAIEDPLLKTKSADLIGESSEWQARVRASPDKPVARGRLPQAGDGGQHHY
jgi:hypothetical protein